MKAMATHSSALAWEIPQPEETGGVAKRTRLSGRHKHAGHRVENGSESQAGLGGGKQKVSPRAGAQTPISTMGPLMRALMKPPEPHGA